MASNSVDFLHLSDRVAVIEKGEITAFGKFDDLKHTSTYLKQVL